MKSSIVFDFLASVNIRSTASYICSNNNFSCLQLILCTEIVTALARVYFNFWLRIAVPINEEGFKLLHFAVKLINN